MEAAREPVPRPPKSFNERAIPLPTERPLHRGVIRPRKGQMLLSETRLGQTTDAAYHNRKKEERRRSTRHGRERRSAAQRAHLDAWDDA